jgi:vancomycin resistance protein YoaR
VLLALALLAGVLLPPSIDRYLSGEHGVVRGVTSGRVSLSRLERERLTETVRTRARALENRPLAVVIAGKRFELEPRVVGFEVNVAASVRRALAVGREGGWFARWSGFFRRLLFPVDVGVEARLDGKRAAEQIQRRALEAIRDPPFSGGIDVRGRAALALLPRAGRRLAGGFESLLLGALCAPDARALELPLVSVPAPLPANAADEAARQATALLNARVTLRSREPVAELTLDAAELGPALRTAPDGTTLRLGFDPELLGKLLEPMQKKLEREPVDARFAIDAQGTITIVPSEPGLRIERERIGAALLLAAESAERSAELPLARKPDPLLSSERAAGLGITGLVSSFTTRHPCCERRVENIHRIADILDGRVIEPGQTVSVNELVGPRTLKAGFVPAPTIEEGEMVDSIGGGVSQFATTFFNALFHGGYDIVERQPHTYWFPRYPMGHEATLSWPKPDIIFKNDTAAGLLIKTSYTSTSISVKLYGDNGGRKVRGEVSGRQNVLPAPVEILPNPGVPPDEEKVKEPGSVGWSVIVSRVVTFADGTKKQERRRVTYKPRTKRVEVHPCRIPKGEEGYTGEICPEPEDVEELESTN